MKWKIYYDTGVTYSDVDGDPFNAPGRGVQLIAHQNIQVGRMFQLKNDFYWWVEHKGWLGGDLFGLYDYLLDNGPKKVIFGKVLTNEDFQKIYKQADEDLYLPLKSGFLPNEVRVK